MGKTSSDNAEEEARRTEKLLLGEIASVASGLVLFVAVGRDQDCGRSLPVSGELTVGSGEDCDLTLHDPAVSRRHLLVRRVPDGVLVEDMGSTNGTLYLGQRLERALLHPGARLTLGRTLLDLLPISEQDGPPVSTRDGYGELVGSSLPMRRLYAVLELREKSDAPVLLDGETGTGKELVARALHAHGSRAGGPFGVIDCASLPRELMESELFGHRRGAFTGATADHAGAFEAAQGGTVLLDEIGELPLELQPKLLRVLETREVRRLGETQAIPVDVRLVAASNRDLQAEAAAGRFRQDLYYRLAVIRLRLPPLRERKEDIPLLVAALARQISQGRVHRVPPAAEDFFLRYDWPGNVRELRNAVQRVLTLGHAALPEQASSAPEARADLDYKQARERAVRRFEVAYLRDLLARHGNNLSAAARAACVDRKQLRELLKRHGLYGGSSA